MKKGTLNFLGRKNQSLYDTNVKMKDMENVELVLGSSAIPESGTASVRARPTVKHHAPTSDSFQGFAVPTPTVPFLSPAVNGTKINGSVADDQSSNGSTLSVNDPNEGEIFVPPPPSMAPPPPPDTFILPPPEFVGDLNSLRLQPPPVPPPKPPSSFISLQEQDLTFSNPPPISPLKPPPTGTSASASWMPVASLVPAKVPDRPKYAPPQPPTERPQNSFKIPPPKPIRISSVASFDSPPNTPAPPHPSQTPTLSTFNPQSNPQLYSAQKTSVRHEDQDTRPKHMLLLEDAGAGLDFPKDGKSTTKPVFKDVQDVKQSVAGPVVPKHEESTTKPVFKDVQDVKESVAGSVVSKDGERPTKVVSKDAQDIKESVTVPPPSPLPSQKPKLMTAAALKEMGRSPKTPPQATPQHQRVNGTQDSTVDKRGKPEGSSIVAGKFSPLIDRKLRNLKGNETSGAREASPLALLMAAKEREKHRSNPTQENSTKKNDQPSDSSLSSLMATSKPISSSSLNSLENLEEGPTKSSVATSKQLQVNSQVPSPSPTPSRTVQAASPNTTNLESDLAQYEDNKPELNMPLLPPPPEFDDLDDIEPPPAMRPPDPPKKKALTQSMIPSITPSITQSMTPTMKSSMTPSMTQSMTQSMTPSMKSSMTPSMTQSMTPSMTPSITQSMTPSMTQSMTPSVTAVLPSPPKATPPPVPGPPPLDTITKSKPPPVQAKPKVAPSPQPTTLSQNQATLLSILKKKMLEMDQKIAPVGEPESSSDDWGSPLSEEDNKVPVVPKVPPQKNSVANKTATLDMKELESKMARKYQETAATKLPTSNGPKSKHQYGMTFTVRPGTKQPITLVSKGES